MEPTISLETILSSLYSRIPLRSLLADAFLNSLLICSTVGSEDNSAVRSTNEPTGVGTLTARPFILPRSSGMTSTTDCAAPVDVGTMFIAAALPRRGFL